MVLRRIHVFESRKEAFRDDDVLQENVVFHAKKTRKAQKVCLSSSVGQQCSRLNKRTVDYARVVEESDPDCVIHIATDEGADDIAKRYRDLPCTLKDIGIEVSTGRVVDFRAPAFLRKDPEKGTVPLIYPTHMRDGFVRWPSENGKKPNAIVECDETASLLVRSEYFVLVKRFSAKEERRRIVAAVYDPGRLTCEAVGFENHLNFFHSGGRGLNESTAKGLALFLNSTLVDAFFRQFSGHTQVNATDLRNMRYPTTEQLAELGTHVSGTLPDQAGIDAIIDLVL
jgi:adenine-specific DNA-methyltransferase